MDLRGLLLEDPHLILGLHQFLLQGVLEKSDKRPTG
jgi:hypothetical protein